VTDGEVLRIGNGSGFYGDRFEAMAELVEGGPLDVLTGDYLAELTMLILWRTQQRTPDAGYARTFLRQARARRTPATPARSCGRRESSCSPASTGASGSW